MANEIIVIKKDLEKNEMTIKLPETVVNKLERSQDEYTRKVGDCALLLTDQQKSISDPIFKMEFSYLVDLYRAWQANKDYIRDTFVLPAIQEIFGYDTLHADSMWQINYDRSNNCMITDIKNLNRTVLFCEIGFYEGIQKTAACDFEYACVCDIYKDILDRDLQNDKNVENVHILSKLRTDYAVNKTNAQYEFYEKYVSPIVNKEFPTENTDNLIWECEYLSGKLKISKSLDNVK